MKNNINQNNSNNHDYSKIKSLLSTAVMTSLLSFNTQALNALDNNFYEKQIHLNKNETSRKINEVLTDKLLISAINNYLKGSYKNEIDSGVLQFIRTRGDSNNVIEYINYILQINPENLSYDDLYQLSNLKQKLEEKNIKNGINKYNNIPFEILEGGTIEAKRYSFSRNKRVIKKYNIIDKKIINLGNNKYEIILEKEKLSIKHKLIIKYNGGHSFNIYEKIGKSEKYIGSQVIKSKEKTVIRKYGRTTEITNEPQIYSINTKDLKINLNIIFK